MKRTVCFLLLLCLLFSVTACVPNKYDEKKREAIEKEGQQALEAFFETLPDFDRRGEVSMPTGAEVGESPYGGYYLTHTSICSFYLKGNDKRYTAAINLETGEIFTDLYMQDVNAAVAKQLEAYFYPDAVHGTVTVTGAKLVVPMISHEVDTIHQSGEKVNTVIKFDNLLPAEFTETDPDKWAEKVLHDAELSGFRVTVKTDRSDPDPGAVIRYLSDSGNYRKEDDLNAGFANYRISFQVQNHPKVIAWSQDLSMYGSPADYSYDLFRTDEVTDGFVTLRFTAAAMTCTSEDTEPAELTEHPCPVTVQDGKIIAENSNSAILFFNEKPPYEKFSRITYTDGKANEPEPLQLNLLPDGRYSLFDGRVINKEGYHFEYKQEIVFE